MLSNVSWSCAAFVIKPHSVSDRLASRWVTGNLTVAVRVPWSSRQVIVLSLLPARPGLQARRSFAVAAVTMSLWETWCQGPLCPPPSQECAGRGVVG